MPAALAFCIGLLPFVSLTGSLVWMARSSSHATAVAFVADDRDPRG